MKTLVALTGARRVLEVGMFTAYCSMAMAEALPPDGHLVTLELEPHLLQFVQPALRRSPHGHKINVQIGEYEKTSCTPMGTVRVVVVLDDIPSTTE